MAVITKKKWLTAYFTATKKGVKPKTIELTINYESGTFNLCTGNQEMVNFNGDTLEEAKLKAQAINEAIKFIEKDLKK